MTTPRVQLTTTTFKVSKPGYDVTTATGDQLAFDSNAIPMAAILFQDKVTVGTSLGNINWVNTQTTVSWVPWNGWPVPTLAGAHRWSIDIPFSNYGVTQSFITGSGKPLPEVLFMVRKTGNNSQAFPGYSLAQKANFNGQATEQWYDVLGGSCTASTSLDANGKGTLTLRVDTSDYADQMTTALEFSFIVFVPPDFTGFPGVHTLTAV